MPGDTPELRDEYKDYNRSQLEEMLQIPEEDHEMIRPEAHREDIRELKSFNAENDSNPDNLLDWKSARTAEEKLRATVFEFWHDNKDILNAFYGLEIKDLAERIAPSGSRSYRKGTVFLMFYSLEAGIMVKIFGDDPKKMSYQEFAEYTKMLFDDMAEHTWEHYFGTPEKSQSEETENETFEDSEIKTDENTVDPDQIPGQDNIKNHPEYMPEPEIAPAQKTEEQKYNEQQARIDRETKKKLQEQEDQEKMEHLPSDEPKKTKQIRMAASYYDDVLSGKMSFWFCKNDNFHVGDSLDLMEFKEGRHTGRNIQTEITYILEDYTGLEDGYCVLAIKVTGAI